MICVINHKGQLWGRSREIFLSLACSLSLFFLLLHFWPLCNIWSSQARNQIGAAASTSAAPVAKPDPLTHCVELGIKPVSWHCRSSRATAGTLKSFSLAPTCPLLVFDNSRCWRSEEVPPFRAPHVKRKVITGSHHCHFCLA